MDHSEYLKKGIFPLNPFSPFFRHIWTTVAGFSVFAVLFAFYVYSEKKIDRTYEQQRLSSLLVHELHQTTENLSIMAHNYVATRNPIHTEHYQAILDIRDGKKSRPADNYTFYWDLIGETKWHPKPSDTLTASLSERMRQAGFTETEFAKLALAMRNAEIMAQIERRAMSVVPYDPQKAAEILHDTAYVKAQSAVKRPISELYRLMDKRTADAVQKAQNVSVAFRFAFILFGIWLFWMLWRAYQSLYAILGTSPVRLHSLISRIGVGDFSTPIIVNDTMENSVLAWLAETQTRLQQAIAARERIARLYIALSRCNKALVYSRSESELFNTLCNIAVENGGMKMAWIGTADDQTNQIKSVASCGEGTEYIDELHISTDPSDPTAQGPTGRAFHEGHPFWSQNFKTGSLTSSWSGQGSKYGWESSAALPLKRDGEVIAVFNLYSSLPDAFDAAAKELLEEMVVDVNFALDNFEREAAREATETALSQSYTLLKTIIDTAPLRIFWKDKDLNYLGCNLAFARDAGKADPADIVGKDDHHLCWKEEAELYREDDRRVIESGVPKLFFEEPQTTPEGETIWLSTSKVPLRDDNGETIGMLGIYEDITKRKLSEERIQYLANFDSLTGLPNRTKLYDRLTYTLTLAKRNSEPFALLFLDLDHFKDINDSLGHAVGDKVLIELAKRLQSFLRAEDTVSRLGGDEFIILLPNTQSDSTEQVVQKLLEIVTRAFIIDQYELTLTACIGIALYPDNGSDIDDLTKNADTAMHRAKLEGPHSYRFFTEEMQERSIHNLKLNNALHTALAQNQLELYYQPQIGSGNGQILGAEALIRWNHPEFGVISPVEFIPIAEESGLILSIGEWVLRTAVAQARAWMDEGMPPIIIAINLSAVQFRHNSFPETVTQILEEAGLPPEYLEVELTESVAMHDPQKAIRIMNNLHKRGIRMSIDDFGTGYSSLNYLKKFKVYKLKIDQSFIRDINIDAEDRAIVSAVISMSKHLGMRTIAEGVETVGQIEYLRSVGCDEFQGYYFATPLKTEEFAAFRKQWDPQKALSPG